MLKFLLFLVLAVVLLAGCANTLQSINNGVASVLVPTKYRIEDVNGEPHQRLIVISGGTIEQRNNLRSTAVAGACLPGSRPDILGAKDKPDTFELKMVVECSQERRRR
jgi:ABC-type Fe3+-hydroxamate transport system substrate-binding protein